MDVVVVGGNRVSQKRGAGINLQAVRRSVKTRRLLMPSAAGFEYPVRCEPLTPANEGYTGL